MKRNINYFDVKNRGVSIKFCKLLYDLINDTDKIYNRIAFVCIGTDRVTGDSFGPLVGHHLSKVQHYYDFDVYGTLEEPVHALNLIDTLDKIDIDNTLVISVDASLGQMGSIGNLGLGYGSIKPGSGVGKDLPAVGDISLTGVVNVGGFFPNLMINSTRLHIVYKLAEVATMGVKSAFYKLNKQKETNNLLNV